MNASELIGLTEFLRTCGSDERIVIENQSGVGGAAWLAHPRDDWRVHECLVDLPHGAYAVTWIRVVQWSDDDEPRLTLLVEEKEHLGLEGTC